MDQVVTAAKVAPGLVSEPASGIAALSDRALTSAVSTAVKTLNESGVAGQGREVTFSLDRLTHRPVVQVVETSTKEVIDQWPAEYALRLAETNTTGAPIQDESILRTNDNVG